MQYICITIYFRTFLNSKTRQAAYKKGGLKLAEAYNGVLRGLDENRDGRIDEDFKEKTAAMKRAEAALGKWVDATLPELTNFDETTNENSKKALNIRRARLINTLYVEGLTMERLKGAASVDNGFSVIVSILSSDSLNENVSLSKGEVLALATSVMKKD